MVEWKALRVTQAFLKAFFNFPDLSKRHISFFFNTGSFTNPERKKKTIKTSTISLSIGFHTEQAIVKRSGLKRSLALFHLFFCS